MIQTKQKCKRSKRLFGDCWEQASTCLIENMEERVIDPLLGVDSDAVVVLIHATVVLQEEILQCHPVLLFVGDHQLVVQAKQNELEGAGRD